MTSSPDDKSKKKPFKDVGGKAFDKVQARLSEGKTGGAESELQAKLARLEAEVKADSSSAPALFSAASPAVYTSSASDALSPVAEGSPGRSALFKEAHINMAAFWVIAMASVLLANAPFVNLLLTPVSQFVVMIHECSHAIVALLTGGHPAVTIVPDGLGHGGITQTNGGWLFFSAQAGYLGTALVGCLLIYLGQFPKYSRFILMGIGVLMILGSLIFITPSFFSPVTFVSALFSMMWGLAMGTGCIFMGKKLKPVMANLVLLFLAVQTALNSISLAWILIPHGLGLAGGGWTDATVMQNNFLLPAFFWALLWMAISLAMVFFTLKISYGSALLNRKKIKKNL
ncbi:MAG: M50 family metallopeptidase [Cyanobacteria bacterium REEB67]|nr:M50 family metallopeptidase [Cyanobacteria bacterium REEB67]